MADVILSLAQVEDLFQELTSDILGYTGEDRNEKVRIAYLREGVPSFKVEDDVVYIRVNTQADPITMQRDVTYTQQDVDNANRIANYTRVQTISWIVYGPNAFDNAELIRRSLYNLTTKRKLASLNLYIVPDATVPVRVPEEHNGRWWDRTDFTANFNENVKVSAVTPYIKTVNSRYYTAKGEIN